MEQNNPNIIWSPTVLNNILLRHNVDTDITHNLSAKYTDITIKYAELGALEAEMIEYAKSNLTLEAFESLKKLLSDTLEAIDKG